MKKAWGTQVTVFVYDAMGKLIAEYSNQVAGGGTSYLTQDHLGSTRVVTGAGGASEVKGRFDYLPFGEEVTEGRSGYGGASVRQKFTGYERDDETGLDFAQARHYGNLQGRFTSPDPLLSSAKPGIPQSWNRYTYCLNNPLLYVDPDGLKWYVKKDVKDARPEWFKDNPGDSYMDVNLHPDVRQYVYWGGEGVGWVGLDQFSSHFNYGYEFREQAEGFVSGMAAEHDPPQDINLADGMAEMSLFTGVGGAARGVFSFGVGLAARRGAAFFGREAVGLADETATGGVQVFQRVMSNAELEATQATGLLRGGREGTNFFTNAASLDAKRAQIRLGLDGPLRDVRMTFSIVDDIKVFGPQRAMPGRTGTPGGGLEFFTNGPTRINIMRVDPLKK